MEILSSNTETKTSLRQTVIKLALPAILENVLHTAVWMMDTAMVGRLSAEALSAVGFGAQLGFALVNIISAMGIGTSALVARYIGANEDFIQKVKDFNFEDLGLNEKEKALLEFCLKANVDANGITDEEFQHLKDMGATDQEIVEAIECMTLCSGFNSYADALGIGNDAWLKD